MTPQHETDRLEWRGVGRDPWTTKL